MVNQLINDYIYIYIYTLSMITIRSTKLLGTDITHNKWKDCVLVLDLCYMHKDL